MQIIKREELKREIDAGRVLLVDARSEEAFAKGHIPSAVSLPAEKAGELSATVLPDKNRTVVTYCANISCPKSGLAAEKLRELGYANIVEYTDGLEDWSKAGLPVETESQGSGDNVLRARRVGTF